MTPTKSLNFVETLYSLDSLKKDEKLCTLNSCSNEALFEVILEQNCDKHEEFGCIPCKDFVEKHGAKLQWTCLICNFDEGKIIGFERL